MVKAKRYSAIILSVISVFAISACGKDDEASRRARNCDDTDMAYIMSRGFVKRALKAPSTAEFPSAHDSGVVSTQAGECKFNVIGYVDAQNGFGAMIRSRYTIDMEYSPDTNMWSGRNLQM